MVAITFSATPDGIHGAPIKVEAAMQNLLPSIQITGLPGDIVRESRERVQVCLKSLGFRVPSSRILVHLSPAHAKKQGSQFDLAIAMSALAAEGHVDCARLSEMAFLGELSLDGKVQGVRGALALIEVLENTETIKQIFIPWQNAEEALLLESKKTKLVSHLADILQYLEGKATLTDVSSLAPDSLPVNEDKNFTLDQVMGQSLAKRVLQIALAGRHHLLFLGPPGVGKSLLAQCAASLLPPLESSELIEVTKAYGAAGQLRRRDRQRPYRSPHHSISGAGLLGGGTGAIVPGEVTLAHSGILFLDEFPEFRGDVLEGIREPLQSGCIHLHRIGHFHTLPARFTLIAAMNPCPCGYALTPGRRCTCLGDRPTAYRRRISGPIWDRLHLGIVLAPTPKEKAGAPALTHEETKAGIFRAYEKQKIRYGNGIKNGDVTDIRTEPFQLEEEAAQWFKKFSESTLLSIRSLHRTLKVARTIADLSDAEIITVDHLREAWSFRCPDIHSLPS